jgi:hypothetical protein
MTDTSMIERVARAIREANKGEYTSEVQAELMARAAVEAMRPIEAGDINYALGRATDAKETPMHDLVRSFWQSMIDKALEN